MAQLDRKTTRISSYSLVGMMNEATLSAPTVKSRRSAVSVRFGPTLTVGEPMSTDPLTWYRAFCMHVTVPETVA